MERAWREQCWPPPSCSSLLRQICEWRQRLGGHCSPSRELVKKNRRSQPTALLRPQIYIWPLWGSQTSPAVQTTPVEGPGFCETRIIHPCCALPELVTHRIVSTVCDYRFRAVNTQTPGHLLAGWALVDCVPLPKSLQDSLSIELLSLYSLWEGVLPAITHWTIFCHWLLKI